MCGSPLDQGLSLSRAQPLAIVFRPFLASLIRRDTPSACLGGLRAVRTRRALRSATTHAALNSFGESRASAAVTELARDELPGARGRDVRAALGIPDEGRRQLR